MKRGGVDKYYRYITAKHRLRPLRRHLSVRRAEMQCERIRKLISRWHRDELGAERKAARAEMLESVHRFSTLSASTRCTHLGRSRMVSAGAVRRLGPSVRPGNRIPIRGNRTGSVRIFIPKKLINTVACPSHAAVIRLSLHSAGFGRAKAGAIGRHLSPIHSCQR